MGRTAPDDGLNKQQRYRLKDLEGYRQRKNAYARTPEERAKRTAYMRVWREKNRARHNELARQSAARQRAKPGYSERIRANYIRQKYGLSEADYTAMLEAQDGTCAICDRPPQTRKLHIDHDHDTGEVRGLLCTRCNTALGWFERYGEPAAGYLGRACW